MRKTLTDRGVAALKPRANRYAEPDPQLAGHYVRVQPSGAKSYVAVARDPTRPPNRSQVWTTLPDGPDVLPIAEAREQARAVMRRVRAGLPAFEPAAAKPDSFKDVAENWFVRHCEANQLISRDEIRRCLDKYILPAWGDREFTGIRRSDIARLLDRIQDERGPRQADYCLAIVRGIANWFSSRHDDYSSPYTRGMRRTNPKTRQRARILDDDELRLVWRAAENAGCFGGIIQLGLLTSQRRAKISAMRWGDMSTTGEWAIARESRAKGTPGVLPLPDLALRVIREQPRINEFVFAGRGNGPYRGFSRGKAAFDAMLPADMKPWVLHDLRRTSRSLMSRAGISRDLAERILGHVVQGVEGTYDRYTYTQEMGHALDRLAALIRSIIDPQERVVPIRGAAR
jgi:integrase